MMSEKFGGKKLYLVQFFFICFFYLPDRHSLFLFAVMSQNRTKQMLDEFIERVIKTQADSFPLWSRTVYGHCTLRSHENIGYKVCYFMSEINELKSFVTLCTSEASYQRLYRSCC